MSYINDDGLLVRTGGDQGKVLQAGGTAVSGRQTLEVDFDLTELGTTYTADPQKRLNAVIPKGSVILSATTVVTEAATSSGAATLTIGTWDETDTVVDADGIDAAIALAALGANATVRNDGAQTTTAGFTDKDLYVGAVYGTAAYTAGKIKVLVEYYQVV